MAFCFHNHVMLPSWVSYPAASFKVKFCFIVLQMPQLLETRLSNINQQFALGELNHVHGFYLPFTDESPR
jgi:hypothetical protein